MIGAADAVLRRRVGRDHGPGRGAPVGAGATRSWRCRRPRPLARGPATRCLLSMGTDGIDGPTDAAGALVDATTGARARARAVGDPAAYLANNDAYHFFDRLGDLVRTGEPTPTSATCRSCCSGHSAPYRGPSRAAPRRRCGRLPQPCVQSAHDQGPDLRRRCPGSPAGRADRGRAMGARPRRSHVPSSRRRTVRLQLVEARAQVLDARVACIWSTLAMPAVTWPPRRSALGSAAASLTGRSAGACGEGRPGRRPRSPPHRSTQRGSTRTPTAAPARRRACSPRCSLSFRADAHLSNVAFTSTE